MRDSTYRQIKEAAEKAVRPLIADANLAVLQRIAEADEGAITAIGKIQPAQVDLTQELADEIVRKIHGPLTIPQPFSDWIREQAKHSEVMRIDPLGYGPNPGISQYVLRANGTMYWEFRDSYGATLWRGTFVPPDFRGPR